MQYAMRMHTCNFSKAAYTKNKQTIIYYSNQATNLSRWTVIFSVNDCWFVCCVDFCYFDLFIYFDVDICDYAILIELSRELNPWHRHVILAFQTPFRLYKLQKKPMMMAMMMKIDWPKPIGHFIAGASLHEIVNCAECLLRMTIYKMNKRIPIHNKIVTDGLMSLHYCHNRKNNEKNCASCKFSVNVVIVLRFVRLGFISLNSRLSICQSKRFV